MVAYLHEQGHAVYVAMPPDSNQELETLLRPNVKGILFLPLMAWNRFPNLGFFQAMRAWLYRVYKSKGMYFRSVPMLYKFIRKNRIDLVHTNTIMALDGALAAKIAGVPHVQHIREITGKVEGSIYQMLLQNHKRLFYRLMDSLHASIVANSRYVATTYETSLPRHKMQVLYNVVSATQQEKIAGEKFVVGLVANVTAKMKNHLLFIEIAALVVQRMPDIKFHIYGKLPPESDSYLYALKSRITELQLADTVVFKGLYDNPDKIYREIDVLVHSYAFETFGRIYIESMASGVPVIALRGGGANELIRHGENGFLFNAPEKQLAADLICQLKTDRESYRRIAGNGVEFARQFESTVIGPQLITLYKGLLPSRIMPSSISNK